MAPNRPPTRHLTDNDESVVNTVDNDDSSHIAELGAKEDMNKGKEMATDPNTSKTSKTSNPNLVEEEKNLNPPKTRDLSTVSNDNSDKVTPPSPTCDEQNIKNKSQQLYQRNPYNKIT
eukprot:scaffold207930_cov39-Attheya_sp.AAC.1